MVATISFLYQRMVGKSLSSGVVLTAKPQLAIVWGTAVAVVLFFLLMSLNSDLEFRSIVIFLSVLIASIFITLMLVATNGSYLKGKKTKFFFAEEITLRRLIIYTAVGLGGSFSWVMIVNQLPVGAFAGLSANQMSGLFALWGSGMIFGLILYMSRSILAPWLAHGMFNTIVFALKESGLSNNLIPQSLPLLEINLQLSLVNQTITESIFQIFLVSLSEEHYRVLIIALFLVAFRKTFDNMLLKIIFAIILSVFTWGILHLLANLTT